MDGAKICGIDFDTDDKRITHSAASLEIILDTHRKQEERVAQLFYDQPWYFYTADYIHKVAVPEVQGRSIYRAINAVAVTYKISCKTKVWGRNYITDRKPHTWRRRWEGDIIRELEDTDPDGAKVNRVGAGLLIGHMGTDGGPMFYDYAADIWRMVACIRLGLPYAGHRVIPKEAQEKARREAL